MQTRVAAERVALAILRREHAQQLSEVLVKDANRLVIHRHGRQPSSLSGIPPEQALRHKALPVGLV